MPKVGLVIGSKTDEPFVQPITELLQQFDIDFEVSIMSAHRNPERVREYGISAEERGIDVIIAAAGYAAHLPGTLASWSPLPVIGVALPTSDLKGVDSILSIIQMPAGIPVAGVGIGTSGAKNAALLAARILCLKYDKIKKIYYKYRQDLSKN